MVLNNLSKTKTVVIGGGSGIFPVIAALQHMDVAISSVIAVSDNGGSSGKIRDEFGFQIIGDLRQSLAAMAEKEGQEWIRKILLYRFDKGEGLKGHNLGNLILTALQDMTQDTTEALEIAEKVFRIDGSVIPATREIVDLKINYQDGTSAVGENILDAIPETIRPIANVELVPAAPINPVAAKAIQEADLIVIGPGDFYASLQAALAPIGTTSAFLASKAKIVYMMNLMTRSTQTADMTAKDHVKEIEKSIGKPVDVILVNNQVIADSTLQTYANEGEYPVVDDLNGDTRVIRQPIISDQVVGKVAYDTAHRSLLRHDSQKLKSVLSDLLKDVT